MVSNNIYPILNTHTSVLSASIREASVNAFDSPGNKLTAYIDVVQQYGHQTPLSLVWRVWSS